MERLFTDRETRIWDAVWSAEFQSSHDVVIAKRVADMAVVVFRVHYVETPGFGKSA